MTPMVLARGERVLQEVKWSLRHAGASDRAGSPPQSTRAARGQHPQDPKLMMTEGRPQTEETQCV